MSSLPQPVVDVFDVLSVNDTAKAVELVGTLDSFELRILRIMLKDVTDAVVRAIIIRGGTP